MKKIIFLLLFIPVLSKAQILNMSNIKQPLSIVPTLNPSTLNLSLGSTTAGTPGTDFTLSLNGSNLSASTVVLTWNNNTEGSKDGSNWASSQTYSVSAGNITGQPITVHSRIKSSAPSGSIVAQLTITSTGAIPQTVNLTGNVSPVSTLSANPTSITGLNGTEGSFGAYQVVTVTFLSTTVTANAPASTEISQDGGSSWSNQQIFSTGSPKALRIRTTAAAPAGSINDNLVLSGPGVTTVNVPVTGTISPAVTQVAKFSFSNTSKTCFGWTNIFGNPATGVKTGTDAGSGITFTSVATANYTPNGSSSFDGNGTQSGTFFNDCSGTSNAIMYNGWVNASAYDHTKPQVQLGNLNPSYTYTIQLTGSTTGGSLRRTDVRVEGVTLSSMQYFDAKNNTANGVTFTGVAPDASGTIRIWFNYDNSSPEQGHMDGFIITKE